MLRTWILVLFVVCIFLKVSEADVLESIRSRGRLLCGVSQGLAGFSGIDDKGNWKGIDVDVCRAIAAAVFGDSEKVKYVPLSSKERFTALKSGEIDVLARNTTWTMGRDVKFGNFAGITYYDGQGFMVRKSLGIQDAIELNGASICVQSGTTTELNLADYFRKNNMEYEIVTFEKADEVIGAYDTGRCDVYTTDTSGLYAQRLKLTNVHDHQILPNIISKEPLGPLVRHGDERWLDIVRWSLNVMISAEELGVTSKNVEEYKQNPSDPKIARLLGVEGSFGQELGLSADWGYQIIRQVGNYQEIFMNNLGSDTPLNIERGLNALWKDGGLLYSPPIR